MKSFFEGKENSPPPNFYSTEEFNESNEVGTSAFVSLNNLSIMSSANIESDNNFDSPPVKAPN